jgi:hypothetical protein
MRRLVLAPTQGSITPAQAAPAVQVSLHFTSYYLRCNMQRWAADYISFNPIIDNMVIPVLNIMFYSLLYWLPLQAGPIRYAVSNSPIA